MIAVRDGKLTLTATDMEIAIVEDVPATSSRNGACTAPAATLYEIVRKLPDGAEVELDHPGGDAQLALRAGRYDTKLTVLPVEDFPSMTAGSLPHKFSLTAHTLRALIDRTKFAISTEETRYYLNGIYLHHADSEGTPVLRAVATDGHRLARVEEPLPEGAATMPGVIIPRKTVNELRKLLNEVTGNVEVALSDTRIQFRADQMLLTSKLIDDTFPEYGRMIPRGNDKVLRVDKKAFADAIARVAAVSSKWSRPVKLSLARDLLVLSVYNTEQGVVTEELDASHVKYDNDALEIAFQAHYLQDALTNVTSTAVLYLSSAHNPIILQDYDDSSNLCVILPFNVV